MGKTEPGQQVPLPAHTCLTLEPLRADGPDALDPAGIPEIAKTRLCWLEVTGNNAFHEIRTRKADDLFRCAEAEGHLASPVPATGTITAATFEIQFTDSPEPRNVTVRLPDTIILDRPTDAPIIFRWLEKHRFRIPKTIARALLAIGLALITAASPLTDDDNDPDNDDDDGDRHTISFST
jgi:hypothetical protein